MAVFDEEILRVVIEAVLDDGTIVQNRKTFQADFATSNIDSDVRNAVDTWVETLYAYIASQVPINTELRDGTVSVIEWDAGEGEWLTDRVIGTYSPADTFANANDELPNQCAAFVIGKTARPKSNGRIFVFPFAEDQQDHGVLGTAALTAMANFATQYITDQALGGDSLVSGIVREAANEFLDFKSAVLSDYIGTQRRRRFGVGI